MSHLSDMDLTVVEKLATVPLATTLAAIGGVRACALTSSGDPLDGRAHPVELGAEALNLGGRVYTTGLLNWIGS